MTCEIFQRYGYPKSFIDKCFKKFLDRLHFIKPTLARLEKRPLHLVLPYLGPVSLQVRTKIRNDMKNHLNCCKLEVIFKNDSKFERREWRTRFAKKTKGNNNFK